YDGAEAERRADVGDWHPFLAFVAHEIEVDDSQEVHGLLRRVRVAGLWEELHLPLVRRVGLSQRRHVPGERVDIAPEGLLARALAARELGDSNLSEVLHGAQ